MKPQVMKMKKAKDWVLGVPRATRRLLNFKLEFGESLKGYISQNHEGACYSFPSLGSNAN